MACGKGYTVVSQLDEFIPAVLDFNDVEMARAARRRIMAALGHSKAAAITIASDKGGTLPSVNVPPQALHAIARVLGMMSEGQAIVLMPSHRELSTHEAANFLNVSRPFVIKEMAEGRLAHRKVGAHRRVALIDLMDYAKKMRFQQKDALEKMAENARDLGLEH